MDITQKLYLDKTALLNYFRVNAREIIQKLLTKYGHSQPEKIASCINREIESVRQLLLELVNNKAISEGWSKEIFLRTDLMILYTSYVVMLESRNSIREYDYMDFSRRIGEMWEPFCKECFSHPLTDITQYLPPLFSEVQASLSNEISAFIETLKITKNEKNNYCDIMIRYGDW